MKTETVRRELTKISRQAMSLIDRFGLQHPDSKAVREAVCAIARLTNETIPKLNNVPKDAEL